MWRGMFLLGDGLHGLDVDLGAGLQKRRNWRSSLHYNSGSFFAVGYRGRRMWRELLDRARQIHLWLLHLPEHFLVFIVLSIL